MADPITLQDVAKHLGTSRPDTNLRDVIDAAVAVVAGWKGVEIAD